MDTLETYPRDELFQTPVDELAPIAEARAARPRAPPAAAVRPPRHLRPLRLRAWSTCRATATTPPSASGSRRSCKDRFGGETVEFNARVSESTTARVHFVVHPPQGGTIRRRRRRRPRAPAHRRVPLVARRLRRPPSIAEYGEEAGARLARTLRRLVPRGLQGGLPGRAPARSTSAGSRRSTGDERHRPARSTSSSTPAAARRGSRSSASARRCRSREVLPMLHLDGRRGRRRAALRARRRSTGRRTSTSSGCATPPGAARRRRASCSRTRCARCGTATTRSTASTRWCSRAGLTWRQATVLRAYAKYMRQGNSPFAARLHRGRAAQQRRHHPAAGAALRGAVRPGQQRPRRRRRGAHRPGRGDRGADQPAPSTTWPASTTTGSCAPT